MDRFAIETAIAQLEAQKNVLPPEVVDTSLTALRAQLATLSHFEEDRGRLRATVLFLDLVGFTAWSEKLDAEVVSETLNRLWTILDGKVTDAGGWVDKHIGDALMAAWGVSEPREDDAERAVRTALALQAALREFCVTEGLGFQARIGLHTGPVLRGLVGSKGESTLLGDTVNLASRLEHACPFGGVLVSDETYRLVRGIFDVRVQPPLVVKGKQNVIRTYIIEAPKARSFRGIERGLADRDSPFIGRRGELEALEDAYRSAVLDGARTLVTVVGEPGLGKSRLLREFEDWAEIQDEVFYLFRGRCDPSFEARPWALFRDLLAFRFEILETATGVEVAERLRVGLEALWTPEDADEASPWMAALAGWTDGRPLTPDSQILANRGIAALEDLIVFLSEQHPVLILLEDLHWADEGTLTALEALLDRWDSRPILAVATARPLLFERRPHWGEGRTWHRRLDPRPLSHRELQALLRALLDGSPWDEKHIRDQIIDKAGGNPFFAEELVHSLRDQGPGLANQMRLPSTVAAVLDGRLNRLSPEERRLLQQASVFGAVFWESALEALEGRPWEPKVWERLRSRDLILRRDSGSVVGTGEWVFRHALLQQAASEGILRADRCRWSNRAAEWVETSTLPDRDARTAPLWEAADEPAKAAQASRVAGLSALGRFASEAAQGHLARALTWSGWGEEDRLDLGLALARALEDSGRFGTAEATLEDLESTARSLGGRWLTAWARQRIQAGNYSADRARVDAVWASLDRGSLPVEEVLRCASAYANILNIQRRGPEANAVLEWMESCLPLETSLEAECRARRGAWMGFFQGDLEVVREGYLSAGQHFESTGNLGEAFRFYANAIGLSGSLQKDRSFLWPKVEALWRQTRQVHFWGPATCNWGSLLIESGLAEEGLRFTLVALQLTPDLSSTHLIALNNRALAQWVSGDLDGALATCAEWQTLAEGLDSHLDRACVRSVRGRVHTRRGDHEAAATDLATAALDFEAQDEEYYLAEAEAWLARVWAESGRIGEAEALADRVRAKLDKGLALGDLEFPFTLDACLAAVFHHRRPSDAQVLAQCGAQKVVAQVAGLGDAEAEVGYRSYFFHRELLEWGGQ